MKKNAVKKILAVTLSAGAVLGTGTSAFAEEVTQIEGGIMFNVSYAVESFGELLKGVPNTLYITFASIALGLLVGLVFAAVRIRRIPVFNTLIGLLVSLIRATPILVQLMWSATECQESSHSFTDSRSWYPELQFTRIRQRLSPLPFMRPHTSVKYTKPHISVLKTDKSKPPTH